MSERPRKDRARSPRPESLCPHCGEMIPDDAIACRHCGSDHETGWADANEVDYRSIDLPEEDDEERGAHGASGPGRTSGATNWRRGATIAVLGLAAVCLAAPYFARTTQYFTYVGYALIAAWFVYVLFGRRRG